MRLIDANVALQRFIEETETSGKNVIHINTIKRLLLDMDASYYGEIYAQGYNQGTIDRAEEVAKAREQGYAKVIEDFAERIELEISESIIWDMLATMSKNGSLSDTSDKIVDYVIDTAKKIAEEMRGAK